MLASSKKKVLLGRSKKSNNNNSNNNDLYYYYYWTRPLGSNESVRRLIIANQYDKHITNIQWSIPLKSILELENQIMITTTTTTTASSINIIDTIEIVGSNVILSQLLWNDIITILLRYNKNLHTVRFLNGCTNDIWNSMLIQQSINTIQSVSWEGYYNNDNDNNNNKSLSSSSRKEGNNYMKTLQVLLENKHSIQEINIRNGILTYIETQLLLQLVPHLDQLILHNTKLYNSSSTTNNNNNNNKSYSTIFPRRNHSSNNYNNNNIRKSLSSSSSTIVITTATNQLLSYMEDPYTTTVIQWDGYGLSTSEEEEEKDTTTKANDDDDDNNNKHHYYSWKEYMEWNTRANMLRKYYQTHNINTTPPSKLTNFDNHYYNTIENINEIVASAITVLKDWYRTTHRPVLLSTTIITQHSSSIITSSDDDDHYYHRNNNNNNYKYNNILSLSHYQNNNIINNNHNNYSSTCGLE